MITLTKKQKKEIVRVEVGNLLAQCSPDLFDDCDLSEEDKLELVGAVQQYGYNKLRHETTLIGSGKEVVDYVINKF